MASVYFLLQMFYVMFWNLFALSEARYHQPLSRNTNRNQYARQDNDQFQMDILMPGVIAEREYLCYAQPAPLRDAYIVSFEPKASMKTIHHMLVYGCTDIRNAEVGLCDVIITCSEKIIMYGWARDAPLPSIPEGVGFHVGGSSGINYVMIKMLYGDTESDYEEDHSGISLIMTHTPQPYIGGIYLLWTSYINIPPHSKYNYADIACKFESPENIHPFAFRVLAPVLGKVITGYLIRNGEWTVIAKGSPKWPQTFYPLQETTIQPGDILAARCIYDRDGDISAYAGGTDSGELCNLFLMYYTDATLGEAFQECRRSANKSFFLSAPPGYDTAPTHIPISLSDPYYDYDDQQGGVA